MIAAQKKFNKAKAFSGLGLILLPIVTFFIASSRIWWGTKGYENFMLIWGNSIILQMALSLAGMYLIYQATIEYSYEKGTAPGFFDTKSRLNWMSNMFLGMILSFLSYTFWNSSSLYPFPVIYFLLVPILVLVIFSLVRKRKGNNKKISDIIIGDNSLIPKDERETAIIHRAAINALAASIVFGFIITILLLSTTPSQLAGAYLLAAALAFLRGLFGFFAWKGGLR